MKAQLILLAALSIPFAAPAKAPSVPFEPAKSVLITEKENKMTHAPSTVITSDGMVYFTYYYDKEQSQELGLATTTRLGLDHFPLKTWKKPSVQRQLLMESGMTVGSFTQFKYPPYDPAVIDMGEKLALVFQGCQDNGEGKSIFRRMYDRKTGKFEDKIDQCLLHYGGKTVPISNRGISEAFADLTGATLENVETPVINQQFFKEGQWWYNLVVCFPSPQSRPIIVRTMDFINYEMVFVCPEFHKGSCEGAVAIYKDEFYVISRSSRPKSGMGMYLAKYSRDGKCLVRPFRVGDKESRPVLTVYRDKLYAFYNTGPDLMTDHGRVSRSRMRISELDTLANPVHSWDITNSTSIQYFNVIEHKGSLYMTFVSGRTPRGFKQNKGDISFGKMNHFSKP